MCARSKAHAAPATQQPSTIWCRARRRPQLFWEPSNLVAACGRCNYGDGARVAAENTRRTIEHLRALVEEQQQIAEMAERLARYEHPKRPAIY
jgi:5-methylcytosine-specific restriction endonuclease McrA